MKGIKASFILTKSELLFLLSSIKDVTPSRPAQHIITQYLTDSFELREAVEGMVSKKLAKKVSGSVVIEPIVDLLIKFALTSVSLWVIECSGTTTFILHSDKIYLCIRRYPHIADSWKFTPYQNSDALLGDFDNKSVSKIEHIDANGTWSLIENVESNLWIKGDEK